MPRKRKTMSGADAQSIASVPGQRYGEGPDQAALQATLPAPDTAGDVPAPAPTPMPAGPPVSMAPPPNPDQVQQFLGTHNPNLLGGTQLPDTPLTDGLSTGPGRGIEALQQSATPTARWLRQLAEDTGNPKWRRLAERAGLR